MKTISRYIMTLALLLTAVTGAWAISDPNAVYWDNHIWSGWTENVTTHTVGDITITCSGNAKAYESTSSGEPLALQAGANDAITFTSNGKPFASIAIMTDDELNVAGWTYNSSTRSYEWSGEPTTSVTLSGCNINADAIIFTFGTAEAPLTVEPVTGQQNQWTFAMPGSDVVLTPQYAPAAKWDVVENVEQLPAALEGIIAGQDAAIVTAGQSAQGTVMYAVTTSAEAAPELSAFSATVPTAKDYDDATTLYVWYYIQGQDTPDGQEATEENTFNDTEICTTPLTVQVLSNKFDIQLNAANANTIEAGKATVTVDGTDKTVTDGKLQGVKMGSEVKLEAKPGYKFRKVEVKKGAETPAVQARTWNFTQWSEATVNNIKADAAASKTEGWSDIEKEKDAKDGKSAGETEDKCFWYQGEVNSDGTLSANGSVIEELKGLKFNEEYASRRDLAIAVDYSSTSLGDYAGGAYLMLGGGKVQSPDKRICCFTIPNVKIGQKITVVVESHKPSTGRGISLFVNSVKDDGNKIGDSFMPTTKESYTWENWTLPDGITADGDTVDILVYNNDVCHIYSITVE